MYTICTLRSSVALEPKHKSKIQAWQKKHSIPNKLKLKAKSEIFSYFNNEQINLKTSDIKPLS